MSAAVMRTLLVLSLLVGAGLLGGCARVKPYERETLAIRPMLPESEGAENAFRQHWQESREGSRGGYATAGGGCGCN